MEHKIFTLEEVYIPHGKLIDADVFVKKLMDLVSDYCAWRSQMHEAGFLLRANEIDVEVQTLLKVIAMIKSTPAAVKANPGE